MKHLSTRRKQFLATQYGMAVEISGEQAEPLERALIQFANAGPSKINSAVMSAFEAHRGRRHTWTISPS